MQCLPTARGLPFKQDAVFGMSARWSSFGQNIPPRVVKEGQRAEWPTGFPNRQLRDSWAAGSGRRPRSAANIPHAKTGPGMPKARTNARFPPPSDEAPWTMLNFPNRSRVFDPTRRAVQFWGHDSAMEWSFFVSEDALRRLHPAVARDEASLLLAFDNNRAAIYAAATKAFNRKRKGFYELAATDF